MNLANTILDVSIVIALVILAAAFLLTVWRVVKGPTLPDRVVALDMLVGIVIGFIALIAIRTGFTLYIDIAIALGLVGFLATVAFARFILAGATAPSAVPVSPIASAPPAVDTGTPRAKQKPRPKPKSKSGPKSGSKAAKTDAKASTGPASAPQPEPKPEPKPKSRRQEKRS